jgi:hypothetical protein
VHAHILEQHHPRRISWSKDVVQNRSDAVLAFTAQEAMNAIPKSVPSRESMCMGSSMDQTLKPSSCFRLHRAQATRQQRHQNGRTRRVKSRLDGRVGIRQARWLAAFDTTLANTDGPRARVPGFVPERSAKARENLPCPRNPPTFSGDRLESTSASSHEPSQDRQDRNGSHPGDGQKTKGNRPNRNDGERQYHRIVCVTSENPLSDAISTRGIISAIRGRFRKEQAR